MAGVIMAVLGLLAAEDLKYKAVTVWKLVLFGLVCTIQAVRTGILRQSIEADTFLGVLFGVMVLLICVWTKQLGAADGIIILFLGLVGGIVRILGIFLAALLLMGLCGLILMMTGRVDKKPSMPVMWISSSTTEMPVGFCSSRRRQSSPEAASAVSNWLFSIWLSSTSAP